MKFCAACLDGTTIKSQYNNHSEQEVNFIQVAYVHWMLCISPETSNCSQECEPRVVLLFSLFDNAHVSLSCVMRLISVYKTNLSPFFAISLRC